MLLPLCILLIDGGATINPLKPIQNEAGELIKEKAFTVMMRFKYQGQIDLTDTISPQ